MGSWWSQEHEEPRKKTTIISQRQEEELNPSSLPHAFEDIIKDADSPVDKSSTEMLYNQLHAGVFLNEKTKKYWVEEKSNSNCFMLFPRVFDITWSEDKRYWYWPYLKETINETNYVFVEVAELLEVCFLRVRGEIETKKLTPGAVYEVVFDIMLKDSANGWEDPVKFTLDDNENKQEHEESFREKPRGVWIKIPVGQFETSPDKVRQIGFSLEGSEGEKWKKGLAIKGVIIRPKS